MFRLPASIALLVSAHLAAAATVALSNGGSIVGEVLFENDAAVYVDLGFEVVAVPRSAITAIEAGADSGSAADAESPAAGALYRVAGTGSEQPIRTLVESIGEAVALIQTPTGLGSGFVVNGDGYIVTNEHVVAGEHRIAVTIFANQDDTMVNRTYEQVRIVAVSSEMDLALLKIDEALAEPLTTVPIGDSAGLRQGQTVFAIGSPMGLDRSVSEGIISVTNRVIGGRLYLQTTTQINPGNSGGPLFNLRGEVVGVNNMKIAAVGAEGLGFSISSQVLRSFLDNLDAFAFDARNPNAGFRYLAPPTVSPGPDAATPENLPADYRPAQP